jgi:NDP-hexose 3,5-(Or5-) epimerase
MGRIVMTTEITGMSVRDAYRIEPKFLPDRRGSFFEACRRSDLEDHIGHSFTVAQVNYSTSVRNTLRGIHGTTVPPGQAKLVTCVRGAALDVVVDLRVGSPTFGHFDMTLQEAGSGVGVYLANGLGHAFLALTDDTCMSYLCSREYVPDTMIDIQAFDPELGIPWPLEGPPVMSDKDAAAPTLAKALQLGILPSFETVRA